MVQNITKSKRITQIVTPTEQMIMRDMVIKNFNDWYYQDRIAYHSERDKFDDRYHYRDQGSYDRSPKADSYDRYYDRYRERDRYYGREFMIEGDTLLITLMMKQ